MSDECDYGLVMPFAVCASNGGSYEDEPFVAGFRLGEIRERVRRDNAWSGLVREDDIPQLDLIAMERDLTMRCDDAGDGWVHANIAAKEEVAT